MNLSSSVCMTISEKLDFGSIFPVISSTVSIYWLGGCESASFVQSLYASFTFIPNLHLLSPTLSFPPLSSFLSMRKRRDRPKHTCNRTRSITLATNSSGQGNTSGAVLSATHARTSACKSNVRCGIRGAETEAKMSSISILMFGLRFGFVFVFNYFQFAVRGV